MLSSGSRDRLVLLAYAVLILFAPVVILALTLGFLVRAGDLVLGRVSPLVFLELYLIDLVLLLAFGYGIYRLTLWIGIHRLPVLHEAIEEREEERDEGEDADGDDL